MAAFPVIVGLFGMAMSARAQIQAGRSATRAGELDQAAALDQAKVLRWNAVIADYQAADAIEVGAMEEARFRDGVKGLIGEERAAFAGSNVNVGFGSALDVTADAAQLGELDALQIRSNAARAAFGYTVEAYDYREQARLTTQHGANAALAGRERGRQYRTQAFATILGGAATAADALASSIHRRGGLKGRS